jgi:hypothetical protein
LAGSWERSRDQNFLVIGQRLEALLAARRRSRPMMLNVPMVRRRFRRLVEGAALDIRTLAARSYCLCPEETAIAPPAIHVDGALEKIRALSPWRHWPSEMHAISGGKIEHAASTAHVIHGVNLVGAYLYKGAAKANPGWGPERWTIDSQARSEEFKEAYLTTSNTGSHFFGTMMLDDLPLSLLVDDGQNAISMCSRPYEHEAAWRDLLGQPRAPEVRHAHIRHLVMFTDFAQNSLKERRYRRLRAALRKHAVMRGFSGASPPGVYIRRGVTGEPRYLLNETELEDVFTAIGFTIIDPATMDAQTIASRCLGARVVAAIEGSQLSHAIFSAADDATFLVLQPPERFAMAYKEYTDRMGMRFAFVVGDPAQGGFSVSKDDLNRTLELVL